MDLDQSQEETFARVTPLTRDAYPPERRLVGEALLNYLDSRVFAVVASTRPDGRPHATLSSYARRGITIWLPTAAGAVRQANLRTQPWVVLVASEGDRDEHVAVIVEGPGAAVSPSEVPSDVVATAPDAGISMWLRMDAQRLLSYAAKRADA